MAKILIKGIAIIAILAAIAAFIYAFAHSIIPQSIFYVCVGIAFIGLSLFSYKEYVFKSKTKLGKVIGYIGAFLLSLFFSTSAFFVMFMSIAHIKLSLNDLDKEIDKLSESTAELLIISCSALSNVFPAIVYNRACKIAENKHAIKLGGYIIGAIFTLGYGLLDAFTTGQTSSLIKTATLGIIGSLALTKVIVEW